MDSNDAEAAAVSLDDASLFINREISWLRFNERILEEAEDPTHPLLERVKFLAITGGNLDEFFMVRVSGLRKQMMEGALNTPADGMTPTEQMKAIKKEVMRLLERYERCWNSILLPGLADKGIFIDKVGDLKKEQKAAMRKYFKSTIFPVLTPMAMDIAHPFPFISNLSVNLAVVMKDQNGSERYARVKAPYRLFQRLVRVPDENEPAGNRFVFLEDLICNNMDLLFPGMKIHAVYPFRITRDTEIEIALDEAPDLLTAIEDSVELRRTGSPIRLQVDKSMPDKLLNIFTKNLGLTADMVYPFDGPLGLADLWQLLSVDRPDLKDAPFLPFTLPEFAEDKDVFSAVAKKDYVFYHPYDSFNSVLGMLRQAATDPKVLAIKLTLYRIDKDSPVIEALMKAKQNGKAVTALVELKAKFDEKNNISWARALEHEGVHVIYGLMDLKVHAKICLIIRKEGQKIVKYTHISSGNYNAVTTRTYGDIGYLTANEEIGSDALDLMNALTGYSQKDDYKHLLVAPQKLKGEIIRKIEREIDAHKKTGGGYIAMKINGLVDKDIIQALYRASNEGVKIDLNVRGLCCLRPGVKGVSENIKVTSIVGRFLEHARIYYFRNGGEEEVLLGSADLMPRNLIRRVEILVPVIEPAIRQTIIRNMLEVHLKDNVKARLLLPDGTYQRIVAAEGEESISSQAWLINNRGIWHGKDGGLKVEKL